MSKAKCDGQKLLTNEDVCDALAECLGSGSTAITPDEDQVSPLTILINRFMRRPWDQDSIKYWRSVAKRTSNERKTLTSAASLMKRNLADWQRIIWTTSEEKNAALVIRARERIVELEGCISELEALTFEEQLISNFPVQLGFSGPSPKSWAIMAPLLASMTIQVRKAAGDQHAGVGDPDGPVVKFVERCLRWISPSQQPPSRSTIYDAVKNKIGSAKLPI